MPLAGSEGQDRPEESTMTQVSQVMTRGVRTMAPDATVLQAARTMEEMDIGVLPVCDEHRLLGMLTDRDIVLRCVARGLPAERTVVAELMTQDARWCYDDASIEEAMARMRESQIRRLAVLDRDKHLVGMVSLGDVAVKGDMGEAGEALEEISEPAAPDRAGFGEASSGGSATGQPHSKKKDGKPDKIAKASKPGR
jgi:CBS domain-containing protein